MPSDLYGDHRDLHSFPTRRSSDLGGGVSANQHIKRTMEATILVSHPDVTTYFPQPGLSTDNSIMIALAGHARAQGALSPSGAESIQADSRKSLG